MIGTTLSHFKITAKLGEGGMGEVYRAEDTKLGREVAIKVLPETFTSDSERLARFEREARVLAALDHPNIAGIYEVGEHDGIHFLAMQLVEGEDLAVRLSRGPIPVEDALQIALQIAEALEAAHDKGIVHRDLKPANVMVSPDGEAKVLDFGLAKAWEPEAGEAELTQSTTLTAQMTQAGVILGTAAYMSPQQARGQEVDKQADIWAFGCVLYELITGKRVFRGDTVTDTLAAILERKPDWDALPESTPPLARSLLRRCLEKDPRRRLHDIADARIEIEEAIRGGPEQEPSSSAHEDGPRFLSPGNLALLLIVTLGVGAGVGAWWSSGGSSNGASSTIPSPPTARSRLVPEEGTPFNIATGYPTTFDLPVLAISPDGKHLAYIADVEGVTAIYHRRLEDLEARRIEGTEGAYHAFFSPGGASIGFLKPGTIMRVSLRGGAPRIVCECSDGLWGVWPTEEEIYYGSFDGIRKVPAAGSGEPSIVVTIADVPGATRFSAFSLLPDGRLLVAISYLQLSADNATIAVWDPGTSAWAASLPGTGYHPIYTPTGHLLFARGGDIWAAPLDLSTLRMTAEPVPVVKGVHMVPHFGVAHFVVSASGSLVYLAGGDAGRGRPTWFDRDGGAEGTVLPVETYGTFRLSPDGAELAATIAGGSDQIHIFDVASGQRRKLTLEGNNMEPLWMGPDDLVYSSDRGGELGLFVQPADGSRPGQKLVSNPSLLVPTSWSPEHRVLLVDEVGAKFLLVSIGEDGSGALSSFRAGNGNSIDWGAQFSPDGNWIAYCSNREGTYSIYVSPYPQTGKEIKVPAPAGKNSWEPMWSGNGSELFFRVDLTYFSFRFEPDASASAAPTPLFQAAFVDTNGLSYDLHPDGRFLMMTPDEASKPRGAVMVQTWFEELKRLVPVE